MRLGCHRPGGDQRRASRPRSPRRSQRPRRRSTLAKAGYGLGIRGFVEIADGLRSLSCPVAAVYGTDDRILPDVDETFARLQRDVPHGAITPLPGLGHFVQEESPADVGALLADFFAGG